MSEGESLLACWDSTCFNSCYIYQLALHLIVFSAWLVPVSNCHENAMFCTPHAISFNNRRSKLFNKVHRPPFVYINSFPLFNEYRPFLLKLFSLICFQCTLHFKILVQNFNGWLHKFFCFLQPFLPSISILPFSFLSSSFPSSWSTCGCAKRLLLAPKVVSRLNPGQPYARLTVLSIEPGGRWSFSEWNLLDSSYLRSKVESERPLYSYASESEAINSEHFNKACLGRKPFPQTTCYLVVAMTLFPLPRISLHSKVPLLGIPRIPWNHGHARASQLCNPALWDECKCQGWVLEFIVHSATLRVS